MVKNFISIVETFIARLAAYFLTLLLIFNFMRYTFAVCFTLKNEILRITLVATLIDLRPI